MLELRVPARKLGYTLPQIGITASRIKQIFEKWTALAVNHTILVL